MEHSTEMMPEPEVDTSPLQSKQRFQMPEDRIDAVYRKEMRQSNSCVTNHSSRGYAEIWDV
jgi:hypothetical protein